MKKLLFMILIATLVLTGCNKKTEEVVKLVDEIQEVVGGWEERVDQEVTDDKLTDDQAKEIVLKEAGLNEDDISFLRIERDFDNGFKVIKVEFIANNKEYSYTLNAENGGILEFEID